VRLDRRQAVFTVQEVHEVRTESMPADNDGSPATCPSGGQSKKRGQPRQRGKGKLTAVPVATPGPAKDTTALATITPKPLSDESAPPARREHSTSHDPELLGVPLEDRAGEPNARTSGTGDADFAMRAATTGLAAPPALVAERLPDLRRRPPLPVVPWYVRMQRRLKEVTRPGRLEAESDAAISALLARPALTSGSKTITVLGAKGGAGKSTTALALGLVLGTCDAAKPVVMEVNPDLGNVRQLLPDPNRCTVQDLLEGLVAAERGGVNRVQGYLTMWGRLGVLTAPQRPDEMARLTPRDYSRALRLLKLYFGTIILDCGTSFTNRLQQWAIQAADHLVLVTQPEEAPLRTTLTAIDYLSSAAYAEDYRWVLREVAESAGPEGTGVRGSRERQDMTLVVNGVGFAGRGSFGGDPVDPAKTRAAAAGLNAVVELPYSAALRQRINDGVLTPEVLPIPYRRALKTGLVAVLGRLAEQGEGGQ